MTTSYEQLWNFVRDGAEFREQLVRKAYRWPRRVVEVRNARRLYIVTVPDKVVSKLTHAAAVATSPDYSTAAVSRGWAESLAHRASERYGYRRRDVASIKQIAAIQDPISSSFYARFRLSGLVGIAIAVGAFVATLVPKEVFDKYGGDYVLYRLAVLLALFGGILIATGLWFGAQKWATRRARDTLLFNAVVTYLELIVPDDDADLAEIG